ncbi:hypothetical protein LOTGIDRAFT_167310 [Lottia gigantea]|uniref:Uncharacterized protein n=1 Tax=Lottia gigantea TaxID=225164 RepID=V4BB82_LOTGI|nr:hypothetical protein LOTGIDRAFT_167310 [Lottia gigantea]ESO86264.1 hypothetical protein LOTGIDRAFT_167310 [Lottia gigantea]
MIKLKSLKILLVVLFTLLKFCCCEDYGFQLLFTSNTEELEDTEIKFERKLPKWLKGTLQMLFGVPMDLTSSIKTVTKEYQTNLAILTILYLNPGIEVILIYLGTRQLSAAINFNCVQQSLAGIQPYLNQANFGELGVNATFEEWKEHRCRDSVRKVLYFLYAHMHTQESQLWVCAGLGIIEKMPGNKINLSRVFQDHPSQGMW